MGLNFHTTIHECALCLRQTYGLQITVVLPMKNIQHTHTVTYAIMDYGFANMGYKNMSCMHGSGVVDNGFN